MSELFARSIGSGRLYRGHYSRRTPKGDGVAAGRVSPLVAEASLLVHETLARTATKLHTKYIRHLLGFSVADEPHQSGRRLAEMRQSRMPFRQLTLDQRLLTQDRLEGAQESGVAAASVTGHEPDGSRWRSPRQPER